jgi:hypothetical protein
VIPLFLIWVTFQSCVRAAWVLPAPPDPGVVQSVPTPPWLPKSIRPIEFEAFEI